MEICVADVGGRINRNMLKLNQEKTDLIGLSFRHRIRQMDNLFIVTNTRCAIREK